jgi:hypothetical protein
MLWTRSYSILLLSDFKSDIAGQLPLEMFADIVSFPSRPDLTVSTFSPLTMSPPNALMRESLYNGVVPSIFAAASLLQTLKRIHYVGKEVRVP